MKGHKMKYMFLTLIVISSLTSCKPSIVNSNGFVSAIDTNRTYRKVYKMMVKDYIEAIGCKGAYTTKIVGSIPGDNSSNSKSQFEHWIVEGCEKSYNLMLEFGNDGNNIEISEYKL